VRHTNSVPLGSPEEDRRRRRASEFLIETFKRSENQSSGWKHGRKQNSNRNKNGISGNLLREDSKSKGEERSLDSARDDSGTSESKVMSGRYERRTSNREVLHESRVTSYALFRLGYWAACTVVRATLATLAGGAVGGNSLE
jgi:hypothetical protein